MAATSGNSYITDGMVYTQAECDTYLAEINALENKHDWMTGVTKTYKLKSYSFVDGELVNGVEASDDSLDHTLAGAHDYYPWWRTQAPDVTEVTADPSTHSYDQWNMFTNDRTQWDADAATLNTDIIQMKATHTEMLATVD